MNEWIDKVDALDLSLFEAIPSQTSVGDKRTLLAVQRATARRHTQYVYLEIGSHLGGSIQPHLVDDRCRRIYSIDARSSHQPDDRSAGAVFYYDDNSTERMLTLLGGIGYGDAAKIECFDSHASDVDSRGIASRPHLVFIDGEHTSAAVMADFQFCSSVVDEGGTILFHDFSIIYPAILEICRLLRRQHRHCVPLKLEGDVFAIFFNPDLVNQDPYLSGLYRRNKNFLPGFRVKTWLRQSLPGPLLKSVRGLRNMLRKKTAEPGAAVDG
jgi:hypothetical protein